MKESEDMSPFNELSEEAARAFVMDILEGRRAMSAQDLRSMESDLLGYDEFHAACAVKLLGLFSPRSLIPLIPKLLADSRVGVSCAASRSVLNDIPHNLVTTELLHDFEAQLLSQMDNVVVSSTLDQIRKRFGDAPS